MTYLTQDGLPALDTFFRTVVTYAALLIGLRLASKRERGQTSAFEPVFVLILASVLMTTIQEDGSPYHQEYE